MKIKKTFLAILAVLTLFASSASTAVSAFTSVEANAATQHKNVKKHKKAKKTTKKSKKTTKKSKKKATKKHSKKKVTKKKKAAKKHSKKKVAKKKAPKKVAKKKPVKKVTKKKVVTHFTAPTFTAPQPTPSNPTIDINPTGTQVIHAQYTNKQYKAFDNVLISDHSDDYDHAHQLILKGITFYNLVNAGEYKTAMTFEIELFNKKDYNEDYFYNDDDTYISSNNVDKKLYPAWDQYDVMDVPGNSQQVKNLTFVGTDDATSADFSSFTFNYTPGGIETISINLNF